MEEEKVILEKINKDVIQSEELTIQDFRKFIAKVANETYNLPYNLNYDENKEKFRFENISD